MAFIATKKIDIEKIKSTNEKEEVSPRVCALFASEINSRMPHPRRGGALRFSRWLKENYLNTSARSVGFCQP